MIPGGSALGATRPDPAANFRARDNGPWVLVAHLCFEAPMEPMGKGRARATTVGGFARLYTPRATAKYEAALAGYAAAAMSRAGLSPATGPLRVDIEAWFELPRSRHRKRSPVPHEPHTSKPDKDNVEKAVLDALTGIAWKDDAAVAQGETCKWWAAQGEPAKVRVSVWRMTR